MNIVKSEQRKEKRDGGVEERGKERGKERQKGGKEAICNGFLFQREGFGD